MHAILSPSSIQLEPGYIIRFDYRYEWARFHGVLGGTHDPAERELDREIVERKDVEFKSVDDAGLDNVDALGWGVKENGIV
ncbi:hypothetical protein AC578_8167, partial [Pseudocercospora eumusae]